MRDMERKSAVKRQAEFCPSQAKSGVEIAQIWHRVRVEFGRTLAGPWPKPVDFSRIRARIGDSLDQNRSSWPGPESIKFGPRSTGVRPTLDRQWAKFGPESTRRGLTSTDVGPISTKFDQTLPRVGQNGSGIGPTLTELSPEVAKFAPLPRCLPWPTSEQHKSVSYRAPPYKMCVALSAFEVCGPACPRVRVT